MTTQTVDRAIGEYVGRCVEHLRDLDESERASILDDIRQILSEVTAELDGAPDDLLGPPDRFVAELRVAAGLQISSPVPATTARPGLIKSLRSAHRNMLNFSSKLNWRKAGSWLETLRQEVRPGWWVLRGLLVTFLIATLTSADALQGGAMPHVFNRGFFGLLTGLTAVILSVNVGRRGIGWRRWLAFFLTVLAVWGMIAAVRHFETSRADQIYEDRFAPSFAETPATTFAFEPAHVATDASVTVTIGTPNTEAFAVAGPAGAEEVVNSLLALNLPVESIWVDFGTGPNSFSSEGQLREILRAFWSDSN